MPSLISSQVLCADVVDEDPPAAGLHGKRERVAQADGPDGPVHAGGRVEERIVRRDCAVRVDPQHLAQQVVQRLRIGGHGVLADGDVQLAIRAEVQRPAVVVRGGEVVEVQELHLAPRNDDIAVGREAADAVVDRRRAGRVVDIHELIGCEVGIEGQTQQAALAGGVHAQREEGSGLQVAVLDDPHAARLAR